MKKNTLKPADGFLSLPSKRLVDVDHYDDLIAIKIAAINVLEAFRKQFGNSRELQHLEAALKYKHNSGDEDEVVRQKRT